MSAAGTSAVTYITYGVDHTESEAEAAVQDIAYADVLTATEAAARFIGRDLRHLVREARYPLGQQLHAPPEMAKDDSVIVELLMHDIERMLRQNLISAAHLLLTDEEVNANDQRPVRYYAHYEVRRDTVRSGCGVWNDIVKAPPRTLISADFTLGVSWRGGMTRDKRRRVRPPEYFFTWLPDGRNYDSLGQEPYRFGGLDDDLTRIIRVEYTRPGYI
ncbi:MAG TPA: hypothetical protein VFQ25_02855 [Ktedonobacterales bacterium]|nr:hypothetical protein [Ktedonobacterales bacterium]